MSYVGLILSVHQSGDHSTTSRLTPRANRIMRSYLIEATWQSLRFDPVKQEYYRSHQCEGAKKVLVKIAR
ncbi:transposase [Aquimarina macrocephali]|uniref:transposase n=1 Tax=Aquimarina macrocephali TaxID=666563 RepID=UPI0009FE7CDC